VNRIERRVRNMVNPYSTAFARWWCHSARHLPLVRIFSGASRSARRPPRRVPAAEMTARRAAIDTLLASHDEAQSS
jgi:hypothetical protein